jgi:hypothetical protein
MTMQAKLALAVAAAVVAAVSWSALTTRGGARPDDDGLVAMKRGSGPRGVAAAPPAPSQPSRGAEPATAAAVDANDDRPMPPSPKTVAPPWLEKLRADLVAAGPEGDHGR